jgi:putative ABC transport system permease protein
MSQFLADLLMVLQGTLGLPAGVLYAVIVAEIGVIALMLWLLLRDRKFLGYMLRNTRRNFVRSLLTVASISVSLFLMMALFSLLAMVSDAANQVRDSNRIITMSSQGFAQPVPISVLNQVRTLPGLVAASPLSWYGGKYNDEPMPFAQFGVDADTIFTIYNEFHMPDEQLAAFKADRASVCIGRKLAEDLGLKVGDPLPLAGTIYPFNLNLTIRAIYDGPADADLRSAWFHWDYLEEGLKRDFQGRQAGNAGAIVVRCKDSAAQSALIKSIDDMTRNSSTPTRTQTESAFVKIFLEMFGDIRGLITKVGLAVVFSLICVTGNAMAMSLRERTTEVAVLKAIGFSRPLVISLVMAEALLVAAIGGILGAIGAKVLFDQIDFSRFTAQFAPAFYVPWPIALFGLGIALLIGFVSGLFPAVRAARLSIIDGLRRVG